MEIFDDINKVLENAGNTAKQKTKDMTDVAKMMASIKTEEKRLQEVYRQIGELVVKKYYAVTEDTLGELLNQAKELKNNIKEYTAKIQEIKKIGVCPKCGNEVSEDALFCMRCGTRLVSESPKAELEEDLAEDKSNDKEKKVCTHCGSELEEGNRFCTICGTPIDE